MADIPGIIEGASEGKGLGIRFLKHLERVRVLCHLVEVPLETAAGYDDAEDGSHHKTRGPVDLVERYNVLRNELGAFSPELADVPEIVALNKTDLLATDVMAHPAAQRLKEHLEVRGVPLVCVSAATGAGLKELLYTLHHAVKRARTAARPVVASPFARVRVAVAERR